MRCRYLAPTPNSIPDVPNIQVLKDGHQVSRISDFIIYSVEAEFISQVVSLYGPCKRIQPATGKEPWESLMNSLSLSYQASSNRRRPDVRQGSGKGSV